jgi:hypothetical protein
MRYPAKALPVALLSLVTASTLACSSSSVGNAIEVPEAGASDGSTDGSKPSDAGASDGASADSGTINEAGEAASSDAGAGG